MGLNRIKILCQSGKFPGAPSFSKKNCKIEFLFFNSEIIRRTSERRKNLSIRSMMYEKINGDVYCPGKNNAALIFEIQWQGKKKEFIAECVKKPPKTKNSASRYACTCPVRVAMADYGFKPASSCAALTVRSVARVALWLICFTGVFNWYPAILFIGKKKKKVAFCGCMY